MTEFSDPNDTPRSISYARDKIGRVTAIKNNQPNRFANVEDYATNIQYRAFGAVKSLTYGTVGTDKNLLQTFNNRLQLDEFSVSGGSTTADDLASKNKYYADGRIKSAGSITGNAYENKFDRLYKYDHLGRIAEAKSGIEARDASATSTDRPYRQTYDYNAFGNLTNRTGKVWDREPAPLEATYANNRRGNSPHWVYDADGRNTLNDEFHTFYDAAGRRYLSASDLEITQTFDGDGQRIKQTEDTGSGQNVKKRYYVNSSVLGTIYEIDFFSTTNWTKKVGLVYLNGQRLAMQNANQTVWRFYENPATGATRGTSTKLASEPDVLGVNAGTTAPPPEPPDYDTAASDLVFPRHADAFNLAAGCTIDWMPASCDLASDVQDAMDGYNPTESKRDDYADPPMPDLPSPPGEPSPESPTTALVFAQGFEGQVKVKKKKGKRKEKKNQEKSKSAPVRREIKPTPLSGTNLKKWNTARDRLLALLNDPNSPCYIFLEFNGFDPAVLAIDLSIQTPDDGLSSNNPDDLGLGTKPDGTPLSANHLFKEYKKNNIPLDAATGVNLGGNIYYNSSGINVATILHESLHRNFPDPSDATKGIFDTTLGIQLGTIPSGQTVSDTKKITKTLEDAGCK